MEFEQHFKCGEVEILFNVLEVSWAGVTPRAHVDVLVKHGDREVIRTDGVTTYDCPAHWSYTTVAEDLCAWAVMEDETLYEVMDCEPGESEVEFGVVDVLEGRRSRNVFLGEVLALKAQFERLTDLWPDADYAAINGWPFGEPDGIEERIQAWHDELAQAWESEK